MNKNSLDNLEKTLQSEKDTLNSHKVFQQLTNLEELRNFMEWHVFAVWDFMSLAKRLQNEFTCVSVPWTPTKVAHACRSINSIILEEESDEAFGGGHCSHFELYIQAMEEIGASTNKVLQFVNKVAEGTDYIQALDEVHAPESIKEFVFSTVNCAINDDAEEVLGSFLNGREDCIPKMFRYLLQSWGVSEDEAPIFTYYLKRHIELDTDNHAPAAKRLADSFIGNDTEKAENYLKSSIQAVQARIRFWDALSELLEQQTLETEEDSALI